MIPLPRGHNGWKKRGKAWHTPLFLIQSSAESMDANREHYFGLVVRKKIGSAVKRNRIKRRLRSAFINAGRCGDLPKGHWSHLLVVKSAGLATEPFDQLSKSLSHYVRYLSKKPPLPD